MNANPENTSHYEGTLLEDIQHKFEIILEGQQAMASVPGDIAVLKADMNDVKAELVAIRAVLTDHSGQLDNHEGRIVNLEGAAA